MFFLLIFADQAGSKIKQAGVELFHARLVAKTEEVVFHKKRTEVVFQLKTKVVKLNIEV